MDPRNNNGNKNNSSKEKQKEKVWAIEATKKEQITKSGLLCEQSRARSRKYHGAALELVVLPPPSEARSLAAVGFHQDPSPQPLSPSAWPVVPQQVTDAIVHLHSKQSTVVLLSVRRGQKGRGRGKPLSTFGWNLQLGPIPNPALSERLSKVYTPSPTLLAVQNWPTGYLSSHL